jgi:O-antigen ligase
LTLLSAAFSYEPGISAGKLGSVSLALAFFLVSHQVRSLKLVKVLVFVLIGSCLINVGYVFVEKVKGRGLQIVRIEDASPLRAAELQPGDVILEANEKPVDSLEELRRAGLTAGSAGLTLFVFRPEIYFRRTLNVGPSRWTAPDALGVAVEPWHAWRAAGFYGWNYFTYAEVLQLLGSLGFGIWLLWEKKLSPTGLLLLLAVASIGSAILLTVTRAVWLAFGAAVVAMSLRAASQRAAVVVMVLGLLAAPVAVRLLRQTRGISPWQSNEPSASYRLTIWREGIDLLLKSPRHLLVGIGMDSIKNRWREWGLFQGGRLPVGHMHSTPIQIALERGAPALGCFLWWFAVFLLLLWKLTSREGKSQDRLLAGISLGVFGATVGFLLSSLVHYNFGDSEVVMIVYFLMGLTIVIHRSVISWPVGHRAAELEMNSGV